MGAADCGVAVWSRVTASKHGPNAIGIGATRGDHGTDAEGIAHL